MPIHNAQTCPHPKHMGTVQDLTTDPRTLYPLVTNTHLEFGLEHVPAGSKVPMHRHPHQSEILFVYKGNATVHLDQDVHKVSVGDVVHVDVGVEHMIVNASEVESLWFTWTLSPPGRGLVCSLTERDPNSTVLE